jgi:hypothetical protein
MGKEQPEFVRAFKHNCQKTIKIFNNHPGKTDTCTIAILHSDELASWTPPDTGWTQLGGGTLAGLLHEWQDDHGFVKGAFRGIRRLARVRCKVNDNIDDCIELIKLSFGMPQLLGNRQDPQVVALPLPLGFGLSLGWSFSKTLSTAVLQSDFDRLLSHLSMDELVEGAWRTTRDHVDERGMPPLADETAQIRQAHIALFFQSAPVGAEWLAAKGKTGILCLFSTASGEVLFFSCSVNSAHVARNLREHDDVYPPEDFTYFWWHDGAIQAIKIKKCARPAPKTKTKKPGANKPCPCGSSTKFKKCCGSAKNQGRK